jgi:hypothetical protein
VPVARVAPWRARRRLNDGGNPELFEGKRSQGDGLHVATRESRSGDREGVAHRISHFYSSMRVDGEEVPVMGRRSGRGGQRSGRGGAPWHRGTRCGVGGVGEQPEEAAVGGVLVEEHDDGGTPIARLR